MQEVDRGRSAALRAKLLLGVAGATAAATSAAFADQAATPPSDPPKWQPYSSIGGSAGSGMESGKLDFFVPLFQNLDSLAFLNLGVGTETKANVLYNLGLGYRTKIDGDWIVGGYLGHDGTQLKDDNTFGQTTLGAEAMSADWDARINAYLADNQKKPVPGQYGLYINGTNIAILQGEDVGYSGFDGEVGYRVFSTDDTDVRVFVGGFHFSRSATDRTSQGEPFDFGYRDISGPMARAEATVYDLDVLGNQSRLTLEGQLAHDDVRGTTGYFGATLRIPLGNFSGSAGAQALDELDRRMVDPVRRNDTVLTRAQYTKPEPVIIYGAHVTSQPTNTLLYVDGTTTASAGTYANPTTLADATTRNTVNAFIVLDAKGGPIVGGATLQPGQTLVPGGQTFTVEGEFSHAKFTHLFDPSTEVTLIPAKPGGTILTLASNTNVYNLTLEGDFGNAIYGKNVDHVNISHVTIDGTGGGQTGINIQHTTSGEEIVGIDHVTISNVAVAGIKLQSNIGDGGSSTEQFNLDHITVTNSGGYGIEIGDYAHNGSKITDTISLSHITVDNTYDDGIGIFADANGEGSSLNQTSTLSDITVSSAGGYYGGHYGIGLIASASDGASVTTAHTLSNVTVTDSYYAGIADYARASGGGASVTDSFSVSNTTVSGAGYVGIVAGAEAGPGASVNQAVTLSNVTVTDSGAYTFFGQGIGLYAKAYGAGAYAHQTATLSNVTASNITGYGAGVGISVLAGAYGGGAVVQSAAITSSTVNNNGIGLYVKAEANDYGEGVTTVDQKVAFSGTASYNIDPGVVVVGLAAPYGGNPAHLSEAALSQSVTISNAEMDHDLIGLAAETVADGGASSTQTLYLSNVDLSDNARSGVELAAYAGRLGFSAQNVTITGTASSFSTIDNNTDDGIYIKTAALDAGLVQQNIGVYYTHIDHNGDGVRVSNYAAGYLRGAVPHTYYYSHLSQNLTFAGGTISSNTGNGFYIKNTVNYGTQVDQLVYLYKETVDSNGRNGFLEKSTVTTYNGYSVSLPTNLHSDIYVYGSDVSGNAKSGIEIDSTLKSPTYPAYTVGYSYVEQHVTVSNSTVNNNAGTGFVANVKDSGVYGDNIQYVTLAGSTFSHNGQDGAYFSATQNYGPGSFGDAIQEVTVSGSTLNNNVRDGLYAYADAYDQQGSAEQHFTISGSSFDNNGRNGVRFEAYAHDGAYLSGFGCGHVQGLDGGCAFVRQTVSILGSDISYNTSDGIYVYAHAARYGAVYNSSGRPAYTPTLLIENSTITYNGGDGLHIVNRANDNSYVYSYAVAVNSHFDHNAGNGVSVVSSALTGSAIVQKTVLYGLGGPSTSSADDNGGYGVLVSSATAGGAITQNVGIYGTDVSYNGSGGLLVRAAANPAPGGTAYGYVVDPTVSAISQNVRFIYSTALGNDGYGVAVTGRASGSTAAISQYLGVVGSAIIGNSGDGVYAFASAYNGASANQTLYFTNNTIENNGGDGIYVAEVGVNRSSVTQTVSFGYKSGTSNITGNQGDGLYFGAQAFSGSNAQQTALVYYVNASYNQGNGLSLANQANGYRFGSYIYYSHVSQNLIAAYDTFDHNGRNGVAVNDVSYYGGAQNQLVQLGSVDVSHNAGDGFYEAMNQTSVRGNGFAFSTNISSDVYLINSTFNQNAGNGIRIKASADGALYQPAFFGGYSYMIQHTNISGVTADGNGGDGFLLDAHQQGRYSLDAQYVTISGSEFNHNTGNGARFLSTSYYGPGGFGDTFEQITIGTSKFSYNTGNGLQFSSYASGIQGRAEQHVTVTGSYAENNGGDGVHIYASAVNGSLVAGHPCNTAQGLPGGCAFDRQSVVIETTNLSYNTGNGVFVGTYANNYGAIYPGINPTTGTRLHSPTLELLGDTINHNDDRGLLVENHVDAHSYLYQYIAALDTTFDHNNSDGIYGSSFVAGGSTLLQRTVLYSYHATASASYNTGHGFKLATETLGGSYSRDVNIAEGANLSNNGGFGFDGAVAYADGTSAGLQVNAVYFNTINHNGDGIGLYAIGPGAVQKSYLGHNTVAYNSFVGIYGEANFAAFQYVDVYALANNVHDNGTNYLFNSFGGSTQILK